MKSKVAVLKIEDRERLKETIEESMRLLDWQKIIHKGDKVVIKPNMGHTIYEKGVITTPEFVHHTVAIIRDRASQVIVGESDGIRYSCDDAFRDTGVGEAVRRAGGDILNFSKDKKRKVKLNIPKIKEIELPSTLLDADAFVTIPLIKTHEFTMITCSLKNQFGCVPNRYRILLHPDLDEVLVELNAILKPRLVLVDGLVGMEGNGPIHGPKVNLNLVLASDNPVAADATVCRLINLDPQHVRHLELAARRLLGPIDQNAIEILPDGKLIDKYSFEKPKLDIVSRLMILSYKSKKLTWLLFVSPLFDVVFKLAWRFRHIVG